MALGRIFIALMASITVLTAGTVDRTDHPAKTIQFVRSFFDEDTRAPLKYDGEALALLNTAHFQPKDIWGNRDYVFGYGFLADGSTVLFAWKNNEDAASIDLKELSSIYEDERMAIIQDEKDMKRWKKMREAVAGAFIAIRKSESKYSMLFPQNTDEKTGRESLTALKVGDSPLVIRFTPINTTKVKNLVSAAERIPTR